MKTYVREDNDNWVFIKTGEQEFVCIGHKDEVFKASPEQLSSMVIHALAVAEFETIISSPEIYH